VTPLDQLIQNIRFGKAKPHVPMGARILDVGCANGDFLRELGSRIHGSVGIDPTAPATPGRTSGGDRYRLVRGWFPADLDDDGPFDAITMLALFEHIAETDRARVVESCRRLLVPGGRIVMTIPAPIVDRMLDVLRALRLVHGMDADAHHGYRPEETARWFEGFRLVRHEPFEFGLNHLFVLERKPS
jgi:SAM-dependent methyltransferase